MTADKRWTMAALEWQPWLEPVALAQATPEQLDSLKVTVSNTAVGAYSLVLAHDPETLARRTPLFNGIMYGPRGLPRADRELGALAASTVNGCLYCASVHARRLAELTKDPTLPQAIFDKGEGAELDQRRRAIFDYSVKLSRCPPQAGPGEIVRLRAAGLSDADILDLTNAVAMFAWANRLMQTLGEAAGEEGA
jgi:uncharacterized peroxidase-related enzyme